jgi:hypothetical protein
MPAATQVVDHCMPPVCQEPLSELSPRVKQVKKNIRFTGFAGIRLITTHLQMSHVSSKRRSQLGSPSPTKSPLSRSPTASDGGSERFVIIQVNCAPRHADPVP